MTREQWSVTTMECDEQWSESESSHGLWERWSKHGKGGAKEFPRYASCAASMGTAVIIDEIRRNQSNGAIMRLCSRESGKDRGQWK